MPQPDMRPFFDIAACGGERAYFDARAEKWYAHSEVRELTHALASRLSFPRKALVFCFCHNGVESVLAYLACLEAGHAVLLLDPNLDEQFVASLVALYSPDFLLDPVHRDAGAFSIVEKCGVKICRALHPHDHNLHPDLTVLLSTSGSTGSPKLVRLSAGNIAANAKSIAEAIHILPDELAISSLPLHYSYGLSVINSHLHTGAAVVLTGDAVTSSQFWKTARTHQCTSFAGVPYMYQVLTRLKLDSLNVPSIKTMTQAGGKLGNDAVSNFHRTMSARNGRFIVMYGQTEATARICVLPHESLPEKLGSCGTPIPGGRLAVEVDGELVKEPQITGELVYQGPNVMMGYATTSADLSLGDTQGGRLKTGDIGRLDEDGFAFISGRAKRFSKLFGHRINLDEVETLLRSYGPTAIVGGDDRLLIFCEYGDAAEFQVYQRDLAAKLNLHPRAFDFRRIEKLPLTSSGKPDYPSLAVAV